MSGTLDPAVVDRVLASAAGRRPSAAVPIVIVARQRGSVVWANAAARAVLGDDDVTRLGSTLFAGGPAARAFAARIAAMRGDQRARLERVRPSRDWLGAPHTVLCHPVDDADAEPLAVLQWMAPLPAVSAHDAIVPAGGSPTETAAWSGPARADAVAHLGPARRVLWTADAAGRITAIGPEFLQNFGADALTVGDHLPSRLRPIDPHIAAAVEQVLADGGSLATSRLAWPRAAGEPERVEIGGTRRRGPAGGLTGFCILHGAAVAEAMSAPAPAPGGEPGDPAAVADVDAEVSSDADPLLTAPPAEDSADRSAEPVVPRNPPASSRPDYGSASAGLGGNVVHFPAMRIASVPAIFATELRSAPALPSREGGDSDDPALAAPRWSEAPTPQEGSGELSDDERDAFAQIGEVLGTKPSTARDPERPAAVPGLSGVLAPLLDALPIGLVWQIDGVTTANAAFRERAGFASEILPDDLLPSDAAGPEVELQGLGGTRLFARRHDLPVPTGSASFFVLADERPPEPTPVSAPSLTNGADMAAGAAALDIAADGHAMLDDDGTIARISAGGARLFGYEPGELVGRPLVDLAAPEARERWQALTAIEGADPASHELVGRARDGHPVPVVVRVGRIAANGLFVALADDAARHRAVSGLDAARREAERTSALKSDFLARVSHEIRTPLNAILGFAEVIRDERLGPVGNGRYLDYLKDIHASGTHVMSLVNDLLDLSRIEAGRMDLRLEAVDANAIVNGCVSTLQTQANRERIIVRLSLTPALPAALADERSLRQIVLNLLSNAIKFNEPGGQVIVSTALAESDSVAIRIRDTGIGMTEAEIETAMEPFRQVAAVQRAGSGLGLPVTKALVEANCASMTIRSTPGQGTLVEVTFPVVEHNSMSLPAE